MLMDKDGHQEGARLRLYPFVALTARTQLLCQVIEGIGADQNLVSAG